MLIKKSIKHKGKVYSAITDNTATLDADTLFVKSEQNTRFYDVTSGIDFIESVHLGQIFALPKAIIGITGTNGKTTIATCMYEGLIGLGYSVALLGTRGLFKNHKELKPKGLTTPCVLELYENFELCKEVDFFIMEVSSHAIAQNRIAGVKFALKILSNITSDHLDFHKTLQEYINVKNSFFSDEGLKLINLDEEHVCFNASNAFTYGLKDVNGVSSSNIENIDFKDRGVDFFASNIDLSSGVKALLHHKGLDFYLDSKLFGEHNLYNLLCAIAAMKLITKESMESIVRVATNFAGVEGRMEVVCKNPLVIVDFAHTQEGMRAILKSFASKEIYLVFGAGGNRDALKRPKMGEVATIYAQHIYITSDNPRFEDPLEIIKQIESGIEFKDNAKSTHLDFRKSRITKSGAEVYSNVNRLESIHLAIEHIRANSNKNCVLLVIGRGDEKVQIIGEKHIEFDDRKVIAKALGVQL